MPHRSHPSNHNPVWLQTGVRQGCLRNCPQHCFRQHRWTGIQLGCIQHVLGRALVFYSNLSNRKYRRLWLLNGVETEWLDALLFQEAFRCLALQNLWVGVFSGDFTPVSAGTETQEHKHPPSDTLLLDRSPGVCSAGCSTAATFSSSYSGDVTC